MASSQQLDQALLTDRRTFLQTLSASAAGITALFSPATALGQAQAPEAAEIENQFLDRKSTRLNSSHRL